MPVRPVLAFGDPRLRRPARPVDPDRDDWWDDARDLADTLADLRRRLGFGRALAGPQIGSPFRLIAFDCALGHFVAVNPEITWRSEALMPVWDDCFSLPDLCMAVMRHRSVGFRCGRSDGGLVRSEALDPALAELVQHEIDHLDGILMSDRLVRPGAVVPRALVRLAVHPAA